MNKRVGGARGRIALVAGAVAIAAMSFTAGAQGNNLDKRTMTDIAKQVAKLDCKDTKGCKSWRVRNLHRVSRHKARGKIKLKVVRGQRRFRCQRHLVIKLEHDTGEILYGLSKQDCRALPRN